MKTRRRSDDPVAVFHEAYVRRQRAVDMDAPVDDDARLHQEDDDVEPGALGMANDGDVDDERDDVDDDLDVDEGAKVHVACEHCDEPRTIVPPEGYRFDTLDGGDREGEMGNMQDRSTIKGIGENGDENDDEDEQDAPRARWRCPSCKKWNVLRYPLRDADATPSATEAFRRSYARGGLPRARGEDAASAFRESYDAAVDDDGGTRTRLMKSLWNL